MISPLEAILEQAFEETHRIDIGIGHRGVDVTIDSSRGFVAHEDIEEYGITVAVAEAMGEALSGLRDMRKERQDA